MSCIHACIDTAVSDSIDEEETPPKYCPIETLVMAM